jgi:hypothetical protein
MCVNTENVMGSSGRALFFFVVELLTSMHVSRRVIDKIDEFANFLIRIVKIIGLRRTLTFLVLVCLVETGSYYVLQTGL